MNPGRLDRRVTFRRRVYVNERDRGAWQDHATVWGEYRRLSGREALQAGRETNVEEGTLNIRIGPAKDVTIADRVVIDGRERAIVSVASPDRHSGLIELTVRTDVKS